MAAVPNFVAPQTLFENAEHRLTQIFQNHDDDIDNFEVDKMKQSVYAELLRFDEEKVIPNAEPFECPICFMHCIKHAGLTLKNCLHNFCRECLTNVIVHSEEPQVGCPFMDEHYRCETFLCDSEVKVLVAPDVHEKHLLKSLKLAENRIQNSLHCKTPNCNGWGINDDDINSFFCPICNHLNCLTCGVIGSLLY